MVPRPDQPRGHPHQRTERKGHETYGLQIVHREPVEDGDSHSRPDKFQRGGRLRDLDRDRKGNVAVLEGPAGQGSDRTVGRERDQ